MRVIPSICAFVAIGLSLMAMRVAMEANSRADRLLDSARGLVVPVERPMGYIGCEDGHVLVRNIVFDKVEYGPAIEALKCLEDAK